MLRPIWSILIGYELVFLDQGILVLDPRLSSFVRFWCVKYTACLHAYLAVFFFFICSESHNLKKETLEQQYQQVTKFVKFTQQRLVVIFNFM